MSLQVEKLEKNMAKLTVEVTAEKFDESIKAAFNKNKRRFNIPGFRRGKAPQAIIEKMYGADIFYEDAANDAIEKSYGEAMRESGLEIVSHPDVEVVQMEKGKPFIYAASVAVKPEVTLGEYKGIEVEKADAAVSDEDVEAELKKVQEQNARMLTVENRGVKDGDHTVVDFEGYIDGELFDGGKASDYPLVIGSHSFIDTFEEQLIGRQIGEECEVNVTFPTEYHSAELAGKPALFKVVVKEIKEKELPELNDEFAGEVSDFDTLIEYKEDIKAKLSEKKEKDAAAENENRVIDKVVANASMELPDAMVEEQVRNMIHDYKRRMESQGLSMEQYMKFTGMTAQKLQEQMRPQAVKRIQTRLVLEAVVKRENIQASEEALEKEINEMAAAYQMKAEDVREHMSESEMNRMKEDLAVQEAVDFLVAEAKLV